MFGLSKTELRTLKKLNTPQKIQDFLERIPINFEPEGDTCLSPRRVLRENRAHCIEGALLAALALRVHGYPPLVVDMEAVTHDPDHVVTVFKTHGCWGAISKTNHHVLRYRDPVYPTIKALILSYFHEYTDDVGNKTLRTYSRPINLSRFDAHAWMTSEEDVWVIPNYLVDARHSPLLSRSQIKTLRVADPLELDAGDLVDWKPNGKKARWNITEDSANL